MADQDNSDEAVSCVQSASVYTVSFSFAGGVAIETTVAKTVSAVENWISKAAGTVFALETAGWCSGHRKNSLATLHLCAQNQCLIIQLQHLPHIPDSLKRFCSDESRRFVGVEIEESVDTLRADYGLEFIENNLKFLDYEEMRESSFFKQNWMGQKDLVSAVMGFYLMKIEDCAPSKDNGWAEEEIDMKLVKQATVEAYGSYILGRNLVTET